MRCTDPECNTKKCPCPGPGHKFSCRHAKRERDYGLCENGNPRSECSEIDLCEPCWEDWSEGPI